MKHYMPIFRDGSTMALCGEDERHPEEVHIGTADPNEVDCQQCVDLMRSLR